MKAAMQYRINHCCYGWSTKKSKHFVWSGTWKSFLDVDFDGCSKGTKLNGSNVVPIIMDKLSDANHNANKRIVWKLINLKLSSKNNTIVKIKVCLTIMLW